MLGAGRGPEPMAARPTWGEWYTLESFLASESYQGSAGCSEHRVRASSLAWGWGPVSRHRLGWEKKPGSLCVSPVKDKEDTQVDSEARPMKDETFGEYR